MTSFVNGPFAALTVARRRTRLTPIKMRVRQRQSRCAETRLPMTLASFEVVPAVSLDGRSRAELAAKGRNAASCVRAIACAAEHTVQYNGTLDRTAARLPSTRRVVSRLHTKHIAN